jgi:hypothetical protein
MSATKAKNANILLIVRVNMTCSPALEQHLTGRFFNADRRPGPTVPLILLFLLMRSSCVKLILVSKIRPNPNYGKQPLIAVRVLDA